MTIKGKERKSKRHRLLRNYQIRNADFVDSISKASFLKNPDAGPVNRKGGRPHGREGIGATLLTAYNHEG